MRARVGIAYCGVGASFISNPAATIYITERKFSLLMDVAAYSGKRGLRILPKVYQKRQVLEAYFEDPKQNWANVRESFGDVPREWGVVGTRIGVLEYAEKGFASSIEVYANQVANIDLSLSDSTLYFRQGANSLLVWNFALGRSLFGYRTWSVSAGIGGRLWGYLNLQPVLLKSSEVLKGRVTRPSSKLLWMEGQHGYGFRGDLGLTVRKPSKALSLAMRVRNVISSYSGKVGPKRIDVGLSWHPFAMARYRLVRSVTLVGDLFDIWPRFFRKVRPGLAVGSTWARTELWVGRNGRTTTAGIGFFLNHIRFGYATLSEWDVGSPANGISHVVYLKVIP